MPRFLVPFSAMAGAGYAVALYRSLQTDNGYIAGPGLVFSYGLFILLAGVGGFVILFRRHSIVGRCLLAFPAAAIVSLVVLEVLWPTPSGNVNVPEAISRVESAGRFDPTRTPKLTSVR